MKNLFALIILCSVIFSCGDEVKFNNPAFQGIKDGNDLWRASGYTVSIDENGFLSFVGNDTSGTLTLTIPTVATGTYVLGNVTSMEASFESANSEVFSTSNIGDRGPFQFSDGEIVIEEIANNTFTGTFRFNAFNRNGNSSVNFIEGVIYKLPLSNGTIPATVTTCDDVRTESQVAFQAFQNADPNDVAAYQAACDAYILALENQRTYCGDPNNALQQRIDGIDCTPN